MKTNIFRTSRTRRNPQAGQVMAFLLLGLGLFLLGAMAFAFDLGNMWFTRQSAQTAADAACTAGAMDLLVNSVNGAMPPLAGWTPSSTLNLDCNATATAAPCQYAALNGYSSNIAASSTAQATRFFRCRSKTMCGHSSPGS